MGLHFLAFWPCGPSFPCILALWAFISLHFWPCGPSFPCILALWAFISLHFGLVGLYFLAFWPCGPLFPCILALWAFISLHFGLVGLHFLAFLASWAILAFSGSASGVPPTSCEKWPVCPTSLQWIYQRRDRLHFAVFSILGLHFLVFWPSGPSFPCILALWAFIISLHFGLVGLHFLAFWPCGPSFPCNLAFSESASGVPLTSCQKWPVCPTSLQWIYQGRDRLHFAVFSLLGLHFLAFWPCGPSFPCILALWALISLHFGIVGLHFLAIWPFRSQLLGSPSQVAKNGPFAQRPYNGFIRAVTGSILQFLAFWAFISLHFGLVGLHFLAFLALWAFISLHFGLVGLHFLAFWPCGPSFPCILALWTFISLHFGLVGLHFLAFWPCGPSFLCILALSAFISLHFGLVGLYFLAFWPCGPSFPCILALWAFISLHFWPRGPFWLFPCILALWAFISLHFGLVGLHFLAFWPCGLLFPCILALWAFISLHFGFFGVSFWAPPTSCQK